MICPNCGTTVPDGTLRCPACHAEIDRTVMMPRLEGTWCESCGARIPEGADVCPSCGMPVAHVDHRPAGVRAGEVGGVASPSGEPVERANPNDTAENVVLETEDTHTMARIESAIPSAPGSGQESLRERLPRARVLVVALVAAVVLVSGTVLYITHPWDPNAFSTRAETPADTSTAGFPGTVDRLQGQDQTGQADEGEVLTADEATFSRLSDYWGQLGELSAKVDENDQTFRRVYVDGTDAERQQGKAEADQLKLDISNLLSEIGEVDVTSGTYADAKDAVTTVGNYLRNRMDAISSGWDKAVSFDNPSEHAEEIASTVISSDGQQSKADAFKDLFEEGYQAAKPQGAS